MLCYRCGSHVVDTAESCPTCGQKLAGGGLRQATGTFSRRRPTTAITEGAPYKPQDIVAGRYLIKDVVGVGPLGFVFRAHDKEIDVEVALKSINPKLCQSVEERRAFAKQLKLARKLSHPNLVRVYEDGEDAERPYFSSQFLDGLTLRKIIDLRLQKGQFFALGEIEPILNQVAASLEGAHKVGPHTGIKPDNVLVLPDLLKVTDWGLGLALPRQPFVQAMKARKADRYLAPELVEGGEIDGRADIYSMGVILGEMLSGLTPDGAIPELSRRNPDVPMVVEGLYRKAVSQNPLARFKTPRDFVTELSAAIRKHSPAAPPPLPRIEPASGTVAPPRPRTTTGMLQLQPRRDKPPPPVPEMPPPPPASGENNLPDMTQPVDPRMLQDALAGAAADVREAKKDREETEVIDSGQFIASLDDEDTRAMVETVVPPPPPTATSGTLSGVQQVPSSRIWMWVSLLVVVGVGLGAGGGYYILQKQKAQAGTIDGPVRPPPNGTGGAAGLDPAEIERLAAERIAREQAAAQQAQQAADEQAAKDKAAAAQAALDKAEAERLAKEAAATPTDRSAAAKLAKQKAEADRAERLRLAKEKAEADKAAREEAARARAERAAADKAARDEAARIAREKAASDKTVAAVTPPPRAAGGSCPDGMRSVMGGAFKMGTASGDPMRGFDEKPLSTVTVESFCVDTFEYPNKRGVSPTVQISFSDASRLCEGRGKRLCTEAEWEKACKGPGGARWPYGNSFDAEACNTEDDVGDARTLAPAGRFSKCRSGYGVADLSGNVSEWTSDKMLKGGSFASADYSVRCSARKNGASLTKSAEVGFRCCADLQ